MRKKFIVVYKNIFLELIFRNLKVKLLKLKIVILDMWLRVELLDFENNFFGNFFAVSECVQGGITQTPPPVGVRLEYPVKTMLNILIQDIMNLAMQDKFKT